MKPEHCEAVKCAARKIEHAETVLKACTEARKKNGKVLAGVGTSVRAHQVARIVKLLDEATADRLLDVIEAAAREAIESTEIPARGA